MSILVKGLEMPRACHDCLFFESIYHLHGCHAVPKSFDDMDMWNFVGDGRPSWCPLVSVPPHGDLIDRDALIKDGWLCLYKEVVRMGGYAIHELPLKNPSIPVIIEAEGDSGK